MPCDCGQALLLALPIARDPPHKELSQSRDQKDVCWNDRRLDRLAISTRPSRPALTPHLKSEIARETAIPDRTSEVIHPRFRSRATKNLLNPDSPITSLPHGIFHNVSHVCDVAPSPTRARGHVAERRAAAPRSPRRLPRRRCTYALLCAVALNECGLSMIRIEISVPAVDTETIGYFRMSGDPHSSADLF